ncbi:hypothetical protein [Sphingomonas sp. BK235]|uniref:hypothetical protein n=1 Tax=Sphingomonas sp. BK235 TaxID=2512131 RepID=UPI001044189B|nr:hypothetical protein [Sphingomonas sp. BK235]TCP33286.1 hypothetical protein EV292_106228 [Sphingomonas sp. BK235]
MEPCTLSPVLRQPDGSATSADAEGTIRNRGFDVWSCDDKRQLLIDAWPEGVLPTTLGELAKPR